MKVFFITFFCMFSLLLCSQEEQGKASISFKTVDDNSNPVSVHIDIINNETKDLVEQLESSETGNTSVSLPSGNGYVVFFNKPGYLFQSVILTIPDSSEYKKKLGTIAMQKIDTEKNTVLRNIAFDLYQTIMIEESLPDLDRIIKLMAEKSQLQVEISGFTDNIGSVSLNRELSEKRAKGVVDLLISKGIDKSRLVYKGYGGVQPIASNFTEEGRQLNNRVELKVLKLDLVVEKETGSKKKKETAKVEKKVEEDLPVEDVDVETDTIKVDSSAAEPKIAVQDSIKIDYKGKFIADKAPLAFSTVNLMTDEGKIFQTTKTDQYGAFEFKGISAEQEVTFGLDAKETKKFKKIFLADTVGTVVKELEKINGEFVLTVLPSDKRKLGTVYVEDVPLKMLRLKTKKAVVSGKVIDDNGTPIKADIEVVETTTGQVTEKLQSNSYGGFSITIPSGKNYDIVVSKFGYSFQSMNLVIPDAAGFEKNVGSITLQKVEAGKKIVLNNIFFAVGESTLSKESYAELGRALKLMNSMVSLRIEVSGHTDNVGSSQSNKQLSEQRAKAVVDYMVSKGADQIRLKYKGYGSSQPVASNKTDIGRQQNRRTEFKVLEVDIAAEETNESERGKSASAGNKKSIGAQELPERFKQYDTNHDGDVSYEEILTAIDSYFEETPQGNTKTKAELTELFDYYFDK
ncbi:MAG: OmpA family protein [Bacteroidota bacterium]